MPSDTRPTQFGTQADHIDPELLRQLNAKRDVLVNAYEQIAQALRVAAKACDEFQALIPRDVGIVPSETHTSIGHQPRKFKKPQVKDPNAPKRPNTAYILFSNEIRAETKADNPHANQKEIVTLIGQKWKALSREQKKVYEDRYFADKERYDEELRAYRAAHGHVDSPPETSSNEDNGDHNASSSKQVTSSNAYSSQIPIVSTSGNQIMTGSISVPPTEAETTALMETIAGAFLTDADQNVFMESTEAIQASTPTPSFPESSKKRSPNLESEDVSKQNESVPTAKRTRASSKKATESEDVFNPPDDSGATGEPEEVTSTPKRTRTKRGASNGATATQTKAVTSTRTRRGGKV
ncbi:11657_t:CDS:2 [Acaulospora colombiana]|uniref:11657_t:CDS:1 n=1 Tax=Acaulospora colombiana TaxID=27376 RepID=A0ACA9KA11_9GLOM|nr:11657_t:CDS:2 [Acaulospora colombiana]